MAAMLLLFVKGTTTASRPCHISMSVSVSGLPRNPPSQENAKRSPKICRPQKRPCGNVLLKNILVCRCPQRSNASFDQQKERRRMAPADLMFRLLTAAGSPCSCHNLFRQASKLMKLQKGRLRIQRACSSYRFSCLSYRSMSVWHTVRS